MKAILAKSFSTCHLCQRQVVKRRHKIVRDFVDDGSWIHLSCCIKRSRVDQSRREVDSKARAEYAAMEAEIRAFHAMTTREQERVIFDRVNADMF